MAENMNAWNDWKIVKKLGEGGFGKVYEIVRNRYSIEEHRALKVIRIPAEDSDVKQVMSEGMDQSGTKAYYRSLVDEFIKEIAFLSELRGAANIVTYDDYKVVERENGFGWDIFIMMELLTPLTDILTQRPLREDEVTKLGTDICDALNICHSKNILHRDIKADNIFVTKDGVYKLGDFGIARTVEKTTAAHTRIGTNSYIAPETYRGQRYDNRADLYSLGILLYRLLNDNRNPFLPPYPEPVTVRQRDEALTRRLSGEPLPRPAHGSDALVSAVLKACAYRPDDRFPSAKEFKAALLGQAPIRTRAAAQEYQDLTIKADEPYIPYVQPPRPAAQQPNRDPRQNAAPIRPAQRRRMPQEDDYDDRERENQRSSSGINAGVAFVIILIVLVLIGGGVTIFALMNRNAVDSIEPEEDVSITEASATETAVEAPTEAPEEKNILVDIKLPENMIAPVQMKIFIDGEEVERLRTTLTNEDGYKFYVPVTGDETFMVTLDDSQYYSCKLDYASGQATQGVYSSSFYSPNIAP